MERYISIFEEDYLDETKKRVDSWRGGKRQKVWKTDRKGYKIDKQTGKETKMSPEEMRKRRKSAKKAVRSKRGKVKQIVRQQKKTNRKRKSAGK